MANYVTQCRKCGTYFEGNTSTMLCYNCLEKEVESLRKCYDATNQSWKELKAELEHYKRAFEEVCRQFNYGDEKDYEAMRDSFLRLAKAGGEA